MRIPDRGKGLSRFREGETRTKTSKSRGKGEKGNVSHAMLDSSEENK
jgi:hypothetical protein